MTSIQTYEEKSINIINRYINDGIDERKLFTMLHNLYYEIEETHKQEMKKCYEHGTFALLDMGHGDTFEQYYKEVFVNKIKIKYTEEEWSKLNNESKGSDKFTKEIIDFMKKEKQLKAQLPQQEISDEEINNAISYDSKEPYVEGFISGAKWYREQLKNK